MADAKKTDTGGDKSAPWYRGKTKAIGIFVVAVLVITWGGQDFTKWVLEGPKWSGEEKPEKRAPILFKEYTIPLGQANTTDIIKRCGARPGDQIKLQVFGAMVHYSGFAKDNEGVSYRFEYDQGPEGTIWNQAIRHSGYIVFCRVADQQPQGLVVSNPHILVTVWR